MRWIIVLGMHRSGTSAFTNAIGSLGASMGKPSGIKKHFESVPLRRVNERLLHSAGGAWDAPPPVGWLDDGGGQKLLDAGRRAATEEFPEGEVAVWKDPRTCLTVPFWLEVLPPDPVFLLIHRHPTEVAASLTERNRMGQGHGYALWERHNADALNAIVGRPTVILDYPSVLSDPVGQLELVNSALRSYGIDLPNDPATAEHGLVAQQRHHTADDAGELDAIATESQRTLFAMLNELRGSHTSLELPRPVPPPHPLSTELFEMAGKVRKWKRAGTAAGVAAEPVTEDDAPPEDELGTDSEVEAERQARTARKAKRERRQQRQRGEPATSASSKGRERPAGRKRRGGGRSSTDGDTTPA